MYVRGIKAHTHTKHVYVILKAALFITAKKWKSHKCLSADDWINTVCLYNEMLFIPRREQSTDTRDNMDQS